MSKIPLVYILPHIRDFVLMKPALAAGFPTLADWRSIALMVLKREPKVNR